MLLLQNVQITVRSYSEFGWSTASHDEAFQLISCFRKESFRLELHRNSGRPSELTLITKRHKKLRKKKNISRVYNILFLFSIVSRYQVLNQHARTKTKKRNKNRKRN